METATQIKNKKKHLNSSGQDKCEKRVREENLPFPSNKNTTTKKNQQLSRV